jgi:D-arabinitol 4-dehydrogenase
LDRFSNPNILDTNARVAMDGYSKIPGFILPTISDRLTSDQSIACVAVLPALFLEFLAQERAGFVPYRYEDQLMEPGTAEAILDSDDPVQALCNERLLFNDLAGDTRLIEAVRDAYARVQAFSKSRKAA